MPHTGGPHGEGEFLSVCFNGLRRDQLIGDFLRHACAHLHVAVPHRFYERGVADPIAGDPGAERTSRSAEFEQHRWDVALIHGFHILDFAEIKITGDAIGRERRDVLHHRRAEIDVRVVPVFLDVDREGQTGLFR